MNEKFHYTFKDEKITVPHLKNMPTGLLRKVRKLDNVDGAFTILEELVDEDTLQVIDRMPIEEFQRFQSEWEKASGTQLGESSASSKS